MPRTSVLTVSSFLSMFFLGIGVGVIGAASRNIGLTPYQIGLLIAAQNLGFLLSVLTAGALGDSYPKSRLLFAGSLILAAAYFLFYRWEPFGLNLLLMFFVGVGIGSYEGVTDALLLDLHPGRGSLYINVNHLFVTVGFLAIALYLLFLQMRWRRSLIQSAAGVAVLALVFALVRAPRRAAPAAGESPAAGGRLAARLAVLRSRSVLGILLVAAACAVGLEGGTAGVLTTFLMELRGFDQVTSKLGLIALAGGIAAGRLVLGVAVRASRLFAVLIGLFGAAAVLTGVLFFVPVSDAAVYGLLVLCGLSFSSLLPFAIALAGLLHREIAGTAMGVLKLVIPVGGIVVPAVMSLVSRFASFRWALALMPLIALGSCVALAAAGGAVQHRVSESERECRAPAAGAGG